MNEASIQQTVKQEFLKSFDEYNDAIFRFCMVKTSNPDLSTDLTQEAFMRYWQALRDGKEMQNTRSFLYTVANNLVIDWYRRKKTQSLETLEEVGFEPVDSQSLSTESLAEYEEVLRHMHSLEPEDRDVLLLRFVEGVEPKEIADILDVSANVVSVRINRAIKKLQQIMHTKSL